jgi:glycosyltransferase involved in cell wall biosynthesis
MSSPAVEISIVVPVYDEEESLRELHAEIVTHVGSIGVPWEVIYTDDHSRDGSLEILLELRQECEQVRVVRFRRNYGQTAALAAGFEHSRGRVVVTLDADLQNDPVDVPRLLEEIDRGYDLVVGWRKDRQDGFFLRRFPSRIANRLIGFVTGTRIHDTGCTLKAFRRELVSNLPIYAEQHRFLPVLSMASGARISEVVVHHRSRRYGTSKYGIGRTSRVLLDLMTVKMIASFTRHPLRYFAYLAIPFALAAMFFLITGLFNPRRIFAGEHWLPSVLLPLLVVSASCAYFVLLGLLAELVIKASNVHERNLFGPLTSELREEGQA